MGTDEEALYLSLFKYLENAGWISDAKISGEAINIAWTQKGNDCMRALFEYQGLILKINQRYPKEMIPRFEELMKGFIYRPEFFDGYEPPPDPGASSSN